MRELFSTSAIDFVYAGIVIISLIFALLSLVGIGISGLFDFRLDSDSHGLLGTSIRPFSLVVAGSAFGLTGLVTRLWLELSPLSSLFFATAVGLILGGLVQLFFIYVLAPDKASRMPLEEDAVGREAKVIAAIPADGLGKISLINGRGHMTLAARSISGEAIAVGKQVIIAKVVGSTALVQPAITLE